VKTGGSMHGDARLRSAEARTSGAGKGGASIAGVLKEYRSHRVDSKPVRAHGARLETGTRMQERAGVCPRSIVM
jgi:hypothetical protein